MPLQVPRILWAAIFGSTILFLGVLVFLEPAPPEPPQPILFVALSAAALAALIASFVVPPMALRQALARSKLESRRETVVDPTPTGSDVLPYREAATITRTVASKPMQARQSALVAYQTGLIFGLAMSEAVALFGFMLHFLGFPLLWALPFFVVSWISMALRFPTPERVLAPFERATGVHIPRA
jgi:hypothetical protein